MTRQRIKDLAFYFFSVLLCGYSLAARFGGFIGVGRKEKFILLGLAVTFLALLVFFLSRWFTRQPHPRFSKKTRRILLLINSGLAAILLTLFIKLPPFPEAHTLIITPLDERNTLSDSTWVGILSLQRINLPSKNNSLVYPAELDPSGGWSENPDGSLFWQDYESGPLQYSVFFQGGILLRLDSGPARGRVEITWGHQKQTIDLYSPQSAERVVWLPPALDLKHADSLRQAMVASALFGEWLTMMFLFLSLEWLLYTYLFQRIKVYHPGVLAGGLGVLCICLFLSNSFVQPVSFADPQLDRVVRKALQNFDRPIFQHQLLTIAKLDAVDRGITKLDGIEHLQNLVEINLRDNHIKDITPLGGLRKLQTLNMRGNQVQDIAPLSRLSSLRYLNLHSNYQVASIQPLQGLSNLETLILAYVQVGDQGAALANLRNLKKLNLRQAELRDVTFLTSFVKLEYLNLHSNPRLESISALSKLSNLQTLILRDTPVGNQLEMLQNSPGLTRLNLHNTGITNVAVLADLLSRGILRDNSYKNTQGSLDIRGNPIKIDQSDGYALLRPYWKDISNRAPFLLPEFFTLGAPNFSHPAGFYETGFYLELSSVEPGTAIYYTLDGSEPSPSSPVYSKSIFIDSRKGETARLSEIDGTSPNWKSPDGEVFQATVVRAVLYDISGKQRGPGQTSTYFVDKNLSNRYSLPVISLVTDPANLYDDETGIYVRGKAYDQWVHQQLVDRLLAEDANYLRHGIEWERPVHLEIFNRDGTLGFVGNGAVRISGNSTRVFPQKSLRVTAQTETNPQGKFSYPLFPDLKNRIDGQPITEFSNFLLRNFGNDWSISLIRDSLLQELVGHTNLNTQAFQPAIIFINGEYWGIHNIRQRVDEHHLAETYQVEPEDVVILDDQQILFQGVHGDEKVFKDMLEYISANNPQDQAVYGFIKSQMDVDNFIDYQIAEIYAANTDWPLSNTKYWRVKNPDAATNIDGRWRWILYDTDRGFGYDPQYGGYNHRTLEMAENIHYNGFLLYSLLQNDDFQVQFINRWADQLNTTFRPERVITVIDTLETTLLPEMEEHIRRWRTTEDSPAVWQENIEYLREFARNRPAVIRQQILERFALRDTVVLTLKSNPNLGFIRINSVDIIGDTPGVEDAGSWNGIYFSGVPLHLNAVSYPGYQFLGWEGIQGDSPSITINPTADTVIKARFSRSN